MRKNKMFFLFFLISCSYFLSSAEYKSEKIDGRHYPAKIWIEGSDIKYKVDVVFVGKAANIVFNTGQILPATSRSGRYITLYLKKEVIEDQKNIILKQVIPPVIMGDKNKDPEKWKVGAIWIMSIDINNN